MFHLVIKSLSPYQPGLCETVTSHQCTRVRDFALNTSDPEACTVMIRVHNNNETLTKLPNEYTQGR